VLHASQDGWDQQMEVMIQAALHCAEATEECHRSIAMPIYLEILPVTSRRWYLRADHEMQVRSLYETFPNSTLKCSSDQIICPSCMHHISIGRGGFLFAGAPFLKNGELALTIIL
jgi:hypothetical protein